MDSLDLRLMLTALYQPVHRNNIDQLKLYQFHTLQSAIIAFSNEDIVTAFEFFDEKNEKRTRDVRELIMDQKKNLDNVDTIMRNVKMQVTSNYEKMEDLLRMHGEYKQKLAGYENPQQKKQEVEVDNAGKRGKKKGGKAKKR